MGKVVLIIRAKVEGTACVRAQQVHPCKAYKKHPCFLIPHSDLPLHLSTHIILKFDN